MNLNISAVTQKGFHFFQACVGKILVYIFIYFHITKRGALKSIKKMDIFILTGHCDEFRATSLVNTYFRRLPLKSACMFGVLIYEETSNGSQDRPIFQLFKEL